ncbi:MAG: ribosome maturation factor RimP [Acidimicrobiia bacterium]|nr:ribosome maturation factor RimP [Actinomycetota bacterium]MBL6923891.1 ribosome maturation factor RimP [Acidimicrobiia bacterium]
MGVTDRVDLMATPLCERVGVELVDVEYEGGILRLTIDHSDGVGMEAIASVTREVSRALDHEDPIGSTYTLEVTSPGLERRLKRPEHFMKAVGLKVAIKTHPGVEGDRRLSGLIETADPSGVSIRSEEGTLRVLGYDEILTARTIFEWNPGPKTARRDNEGDNGPSSVVSEEQPVGAAERKVGT